MRLEIKLCDCYNVKKEDDFLKEKELIETIRKITDRGNNAEVKKAADGSLVVYEVKKQKHIISA